MSMPASAALPGRRTDPVPSSDRPPLLRAGLASGFGIVTAAEARAAGVRPASLQRMVRHGELLSIAKGMYVDRRLFESRSAWERFEVRSAAFALRSGPRVAAGEWSAAALTGLPTFGRPPDLPMVLRHGVSTAGTSRTPTGRVRHHPLDGLIQLVRSVPVTEDAFTAVDLARSLPFDQALALIDSVARRGSGDDQLTEMLRRLDGYPGIDRARLVVRHADPRSESVLESVGRAALIAAGLPAPVSNVWIADGPQPRRVDHLYVAGALVLEADGAGKYTDRAAAVLRAEKEREYRLRQLGFEVVRYDWALASGRPHELAIRVATALSERTGRVAPPIWSLDRPR